MSLSDRATRFDRLDALRGLALVWMAAFHFCFDLSHVGLLQANFYVDPLWTTQRTLILSTFLLCAGAGQAIATAQGQSWPRFWKRWAQIVACALAVSLGSGWMFPQSYIYFGVLHGMAVMLIMARLSAPLGAWLWPLGLVVVSLPQWVSHAWFDTRLTSVLGLVTHKPLTEDYVPLTPWLGVMWWGLAATQWLLRRKPSACGVAGIMKSVTSTSQAHSRNSSARASGELASPTIVSRSSRSRTARKPMRKIGWSSARTMRSGCSDAALKTGSWDNSGILAC